MEDNFNREYCIFLMDICGHPKKNRKAKALELGWRPATKTETDQNGYEWVRI